MKSLTFTQIVTLFALSFVLFSCTRYKVRADGEDKVTIDYDESGYKVGEKIECGFKTCTIIEVIGHPTPPPPVSAHTYDTVVVNGFPGIITTIAWPEEIEAAAKIDILPHQLQAITWLTYRRLRQLKEHSDSNHWQPFTTEDLF